MKFIVKKKRAKKCQKIIIFGEFLWMRYGYVSVFLSKMYFGTIQYIYYVVLRKK